MGPRLRKALNVLARQQGRGLANIAAAWQRSGASRSRMHRCATGAKDRSERFAGFKRHVLRDLDHDLIRAVGLTAANVPEATVTDEFDGDLRARHAQLAALHIDRAYLTSRWVHEREADLANHGKA